MILIITISLFISLPVFADSGLGLTGDAPPSFSARRVVSPATATSATTEPAYTETESVDPMSQNLGTTQGYQGTTQGGMESANSTDTMGKLMQLAGAAKTAALMRICPTHNGGWACAEAALTAIQTISAGTASSNGQATAAYFDQGNTGYGTDGVADVRDIYNEQSEETLKQLKGMGYSVNPDGSVTLPSGEQVTSADIASKDFLMGQGLSESEAEAALAQLASANSATAGLTGGDANAGGTGGTASGDSSGGQVLTGLDGETSAGALPDEIIEEVQYRGKLKPKSYRMPASQAAEFSKDFHGTPIGIGMADIFLIVKKKYNQEKDKKNQFINREY